MKTCLTSLSVVILLQCGHLGSSHHHELENSLLWARKRHTSIRRTAKDFYWRFWRSQLRPTFLIQMLLLLCPLVEKAASVLDELLNFFIFLFPDFDILKLFAHFNSKFCLSSAPTKSTRPSPTPARPINKNTMFPIILVFMIYMI